MLAHLLRLSFALALGLSCSGAVEVAAADTPDPFQWLEDVGSDRSRAFVAQENARARAALEQDPRYEPFRRTALAIFTARDRIPTPSFRGDGVDNFWQDGTHRRGLWRRVDLAGFGAVEPGWRTILDLDALAETEKADLYWKGAQCLPPAETVCLVRLSVGGKDAVRLREFDTVTGRFAPGGFDLPEAKQDVDWLDADTLLVARDFGPGTLTRSGYPFVLKALRRG